MQIIKGRRRDQLFAAVKENYLLVYQSWMLFECFYVLDTLYKFVEVVKKWTCKYWVENILTERIYDYVIPVPVCGGLNWVELSNAKTGGYFQIQKKWGLSLLTGHGSHLGPCSKLQCAVIRGPHIDANIPQISGNAP